MAEESTLEKSLSKFATERGWYCRKWSSPARRGVPDQIFISPQGVVWFLEFKSSKGKLSKLQEREIRLLVNNNANVRVIDDITDGKAFIILATK